MELKNDRVKETYFTAIKYSFFIMVISGVIIFLTANIIPNFFQIILK